MKKTLCLYFQVHQPLRLRQYRFFDIGIKQDYYDEYANRSIARKAADRCYLPMNNLLLELIGQYGKKFKVGFSITGLAVEQFERYTPEVLESFQKLAKTGCVEFLSETYSHSLASLKDLHEFEQQVGEHTKMIKKYFGQTPVTFRNTELIYSDEIGAKVAEMGYAAMLTEGARHVLGWKSPNYIYANVYRPELKLLLKNYRLSDDIAVRFSDRTWPQFPLTADKYAAWLHEEAGNGELINLFMDYETFGERQNSSSGIFEFFRHLPAAVSALGGFEWLTPAEAAKKHRAVAPLHVPYPISWTDEERDISAWLGNELQTEAFNQLYRLGEKMNAVKEKNLLHDFSLLQAGEHLYYMCTKFFSDGAAHKYSNPYDTPYEAFINYMNVLSDFIVRVENHVEKRITKKVTIEKKSLTLHKISNTKKNKINKTPKTIVMKKISPLAAAMEMTPKPAAKKAAPAKKATAKKAVKKAAPAKKATAKKAAPKKKVAVKKAAPAKKVTAKKAAAPKKKVVKKAAPKKVVKKAVAKKAAPAKKATARKAVAKKAVAKKVVAKKAVAKKVAPKKAVAAKKTTKKVAPKKK